MILSVFKKVFSKTKYILLASFISIIVFSFTVWFPNFQLIVKFMGHKGVSFSEKINLPINLLKSISTNFTFLTAMYTIVISLLFGVNMALIVYLFRRKITQIKHSGYITGFFGILSGVLGIGCAACGSLLLTSLLPIVGASSVLAFFPLGGSEFNILSMILLVISIYIISRQINNPLICKI